MPARKPSKLHTRHSAKAELEKRAADEDALQPDRGLPMRAPARLDGHDFAAATWRRIIRTWSELEATVVTRLDLDLLIDYCLLSEQVTELDKMRKVAYQVWLDLAGKHDQVKTDAAKEKDQAKAEALEEAAIELAIKVVGAFDAVVKLDSRVDRKRDLLLKWRQSMYLTPRSRAGVAPDKKDKEPEELDPLEKLLRLPAYENGDAPDDSK